MTPGVGDDDEPVFGPLAMSSRYQPPATSPPPCPVVAGIVCAVQIILVLAGIILLLANLYIAISAV